MCAIFFSVCVCFGDTLRFSVSGIFHNPVVCFLVPGWWFFPCVYCSIILLWTQLCIYHHRACQLRQVSCVWYWASYGPTMLLHVSMVNILNMNLFIEWVGNLGIPHKWVVPCLFMCDVVQSLQIMSCWLCIGYYCFIFFSGIWWIMLLA